MQQKLDHLANRSQWNNLRFVGFPGGCQGQDALEFVGKVIPQMLNSDFQGDFEIERVLGILSTCRPDGQPPRQILARFL